MSGGYRVETRPRPERVPPAPRDARPWWRRLPVLPALAALVVVLLLAALGRAAVGPDATLSAQGSVTLAVFAVAVWCWIFAPVDDTYVALGAAVILVLLGVLPTADLFDALGEDTVWLLLAAFVIAAGVTTSGLAARGAAFILTGAHSPRGLFHLTTAALTVTAFAVPSTSGRAALTLPVFLALAAVLAERRRLVVALSLLFPSVILLTAVASYLGAGAHLVTSQILQASGHEGFTFAGWLVLGLPLALVSGHVCAELVLWLFTDRAERRHPLDVTLEQLAVHVDTPLTGPLTVPQSRSALLLGAVVLLWCSEPLHGLHPGVVALLGALVSASPRYGAVRLARSLKSVPWPMLIFMASTLALGQALVATGAADWAAGLLLGPAARLGGAAAVAFVVLVVVVSTAAHLVLQSRSARSAVLVPIVVALAPGLGVDPVGAALASTAAAGFCHTLTSSAKPVTLFADVDDAPHFGPADLLRLSAVLGPVMVVLVLLFSFVVWPALGVPILLR